MSANSPDLATGTPKREEPRPNVPDRRKRAAVAPARFSGLFVLAGFIAVYAVVVPSTFLTTPTALSVLNGIAVTGVISLGLLFTLSTGAFDISFASVFGVAGILCAKLMVQLHLPIVVAIIAAIAFGLLVGAVNAFFVLVVGVDSIIVTLGTSSLLGATNSLITNGGQFISGLPAGFTNLAARHAGIPLAPVYLAALAACAWYVLEHTPLGRKLQATGAGREAARLAGVNTRAMTLLAFLVGGGLAATAGVLVTAQIGTGSPSIGDGYLLPVFAAVFLGTTQLKPGRFNVGGTIVSILLLATGVKGLLLIGAQPWITNAFNGAALLLAVSVAAATGRPGDLRRLLTSRRRRRATPASLQSEAAPN